MSEPYAALAQFTIDRPALIAALDEAPKLPAAWADWEKMGGQWHGFSWTTDLPGVLESAGRMLESSYRKGVGGVLHFAEAPALARCAYDEAARRFTFGTLTFSQNLTDLVFFFTVARGLAAFLRDGQSGYAIVHNYIWDYGDPTLAVMGLGADGHSRFLDAKADASAYQAHVEEAKTEFRDIYGVYERGGHLEIFDKITPGRAPVSEPDALAALESLR